MNGDDVRDWETTGHLDGLLETGDVLGEIGGISQFSS